MGDVMLARGVMKHYFERPQDFLLTDIRAVLNQYDLVFLNLENPVSVRGTPHPIQDPNVTFRSHPDTLNILKNLGVTVVSLGNNHMLDYGEEALADTLEHLEFQGIRHIGAGINYEDANRPLFLECNDQKIAMLSYVFLFSASTEMARGNRPGVSDYRIKHILPRIDELKRNGYLVIVSAHWGLEYSLYPLPYQMRMARKMIDNGAAIVIGHGPHYPQGIESYKDGQIVYSLGNFVFDEPHKFANRSFIYGAELSNNMRPENRRIYPYHIVNHVPTIVDSIAKERIEKIITSLGECYPRKSKNFWKKINNIYFMDIFHRVIQNRSIKYLYLPPLRFYFSIGFANIIKKIKIDNVTSLLKVLCARMISKGKENIRKLFPLPMRKNLSIWISRKKWLSSKDYWSAGIIRDLMSNNPKEFHKFIWSNHIRCAAKHYDSDSLFIIEKMEPTRIELFNDLRTVMEDLGIEPGKDIHSVLEVGCSLGYLLRFIETDIMPDVKELVGVDIDRHAIEKGSRYLSRNGSKVCLIHGDMEDLEDTVAGRFFDFTFAAGVLSYLNHEDALKIVRGMLRRTNKIMALVGLANPSFHNKELSISRCSEDHNYQWIHNFEALVEEAGGRVVKSRWEGTKLYNYQSLYYVFASKV